MAHRSLVLASLLTLVTAVPLTGPLVSQARGEDSSPTDVDQGKHTFLGVINASSVFVRSGPREDAYPTMKLDKGAQVTVIGMKFTWLKILPPEGSFAYVPKVYVQRRNNGSVGRASRETVAKAGSVLNPMKIAPMAKIEENEDVEIIGEQDEYFKIKPPEGSVLYVNTQFVDPVKVIAKAGEKPLPPAIKDPGPAVNPNSGNTGQDAFGGAGASNDSTTKPSNNTEVVIAETQPSTRPSESASAATEFDRLEALYAAASEKSITDQPIPELQTGYEALLKQDALPPSMRRIAQVRVATLKIRDEARQEFLAVQAGQEKSKEREKVILAEREEIKDRIKQNTITVYQAVGTLRSSSIQHANQILYRLTDPASGHTVAYVRSADARYAPMIGQFVGVKGPMNIDPALNMKIIEEPTVLESVDPSKVNGSVAAQVIPPSLMPKGGAVQAQGQASGAE